MSGHQLSGEPATQPDHMPIARTQLGMDKTWTCDCGHSGRTSLMGGSHDQTAETHVQDNPGHTLTLETHIMETLHTQRRGPQIIPVKPKTGHW